MLEQQLSYLHVAASEKRHDAVVVIDYFIRRVSMHIAVIAIVGRIFQHLARENITPTRAITRDIVNSCNKGYIFALATATKLAILTRGCV